jgi:hypothetical protein
MTDWVKAEKKLPRDPRTRRIARHLTEKLVTLERFSLNASVTFVVGCIVQLRIYAHDHIGDDNVLAISADDIDEIVGYTGFAKLLPADWLQILDGERVKLPEFHELYGAAAQKRDQTNVRVQRHRNSETHERSTSQRSSNVAALHERNNHTPRHVASLSPRSISKPKRERLPGIPIPEPFELTEDRRALADARGIDPVRTFEKFVLHFRSNGELLADWDARWARWCLDERPTPEEQTRVATRYRADRAMSEARAYATSIQCPLQPYPADSGETYRSRVRTWEVQNPRVDARPAADGTLPLGKGRL